MLCQGPCREPCGGRYCLTTPWYSLGLRTPPLDFVKGSSEASPAACINKKSRITRSEPPFGYKCVKTPKSNPHLDANNSSHTACVMSELLPSRNVSSDRRERRKRHSEDSPEWLWNTLASSTAACLHDPKRTYLQQIQDSASGLQVPFPRTRCQ